MKTVPCAAELIDLARYPIHQLTSVAGRELLRRCHDEFQRSGACLLPGFVKDSALARMVAGADALIPVSHHNSHSAISPYQEAVTQPGKHPRRRGHRGSTHVIAYDLIPAEHGVRVLYESELVLDFVAAVLGEPILYRYDDALAGLNIAANLDGDRNGWHFDQCDFVTSLLLREAHAGGKFQYVPRLRSADDEKYDEVKAVLDGDDSRVVTLPFTAGALAVFKGRCSMHRVTPVSGDPPRLVALLGYDTQAGVQMSDQGRLRRFGRLH